MYPHRELGEGSGSSYYPPSHRFYRTEHNNWQELGPKAGALIGRVTDAVTGAPIKPYATVVVAWSSDPSTFMAVNSELAGELDPSTGKWKYHGNIQGKYRVLVPPDTELTVKATALAKGYKPYQYQGVITISAGQDKVLDIQLQPEDKDK